MTILQASAIPFRVREGACEVCLITSTRSGTWGFPKGVIEPGDTAQETALKEALEEAGLRGAIVGASLGCYRYEKWETQLEVDVYLMAVNACASQWREMHLRQRRWVAISQLNQFDVKRPPPKILQTALRLMGEAAPR